MGNQKEQPDGPAGSEAGQGGETFKREGPSPATNDNGDTVEEMNREAEESVARNVEPDGSTG